MDPSLVEKKSESQDTKLVYPVLSTGEYVNLAGRRDVQNVWLKPVLDENGKPIITEKGLVVREIELFDSTSVPDRVPQEEKNANRYQLIIPASLGLMFFGVVASMFLPVWVGIPFMALAIFMLGALIFLAGQNFWLWVAYRYGKTRNWGLKFRNYISGRKELTIGELKEKEEFYFFDVGGQKRSSFVRTRNPKYVSNLGIPFVLYREGLIDSVDIDQEYPSTYEDRESSLDLISSYRAGELSNADELSALKKKKDEQNWLLLGLAVIGILLLVILWQNNSLPSNIAESLKPVLENALANAPAGVQAVPDVNVISGQVVPIQVPVGG